MRDTTQEAKETVDTSRLRRIVYSAVRYKGQHGMTCDELELFCKLTHQTAGPRLRELFLSGRIKDSGLRRLTRSGRKAIVWVVKQ